MTRHPTTRLPRGRPREFDPDIAVARAMDAFWDQGYHGTSLENLLKATGLSRGSLYAAFGDKHALFLQALDRYIDDAVARLDSELDPGADPIGGLRIFLNGYVDRISGAEAKRGCLVVASAMELAAHDDQVERRIQRFFRAMETRLVVTLERARAAGQLARGVEPAAAARLLLCLVEGMRVVGKTGPSRTVSRHAVRALVDMLAA